jgi:preprotein translocase subunit YajC
MSLLGITVLQILPLGVVFAILYLAFIRPQWRRAGAHKKMLQELGPGDRVLTEGGLYARIDELLDENDLILEFSPEVKLKATRLAISEIVEKAPAGDATLANKPAA